MFLADLFPVASVAHAEIHTLQKGGWGVGGLGTKQRRRIKAEKKAKVVAAAWGAELIQFFAMQAILHQDDLKNRMNCTRTK